MNEITESELPGIGKKFTLSTVEGGTVTVIVHLNGRRDVYYSEDEEAEPAFFALTDEEARRLSAVLGDTFYKPAPIDMLRSAIAAGAGVELRVREGWAAVGRSLRELDVRRQTGASVLAIKRGPETIVNPSASAVLRKDDLLIVMGGAEDLKKLERLVHRG
jgi:TrkA domain protein